MRRGLECFVQPSTAVALSALLVAMPCRAAEYCCGPGCQPESTGVGSTGVSSVAALAWEVAMLAFYC